MYACSLAMILFIHTYVHTCTCDNVPDHIHTYTICTCCVQYDTTQRGNGEPKILDGGFQRWHLSYGPLCVGTLKVPVAVSKNKAMSSNGEIYMYCT